MFPQVRWKKKKKRKEETKVNDNGRNEEWTMVIFCRVYNGIATMGEKWGSRVAATGFLPADYKSTITDNRFVR